jgi:homoserine kinase
MNKIRIKSPATIANLSCGFDVLGLCLDKPYDEIEVTKNSSRNIILNIEDSQFSNIPSNPKQNTGGVPAELILNDLNLDYGFTISIKKGIPLCGGLGSSAATASGVVFAINKLLDTPLSMKQMLLVI